MMSPHRRPPSVRGNMGRDLRDRRYGLFAPLISQESERRPRGPRTFHGFSINRWLIILALVNVPKLHPRPAN